MAFGEHQEFAGTARFEIRRRLGAGGMGVVYEAFDRDRGQAVALKTIQNYDAAALYRFKKEFRALQDVSHPNLVRFYELISEDRLWFYTMELVDGVDFLEFVRPRDEPDLGGARTRSLDDPDSTDEVSRPWPGGPTTRFEAGPGEAGPPQLESTSSDRAVAESTYLDPPQPGESTLAGPPRVVHVPRLRMAMRQLAGALAAVHELGKLHRDLKPSNVLVARDGRVVVLDFGLTTDLDPGGDHNTTEGNIVGTIGYMSPEQAAGEPLSAASDWYSVGVMLYRALTGRLPFEGRRLDVLIKKQMADPIPPQAVAEGLPEELCDLCTDLIRRSPDDRPTASEVLRRLGGELDVSPSARAIRGPADGATATGPRRRPFVGREAELAALREAFEASQRGRATLALVHGRSGAGKSALVDRFLDLLTVREPAVVLSGRCYEQESVAYKALDTVVDALSRHLRRLSRLEAEALLPRDIAALARLFPVLRRVEAVANAPARGQEIPDPQELRRRASGALRELLGRIGDRVPLILAIDDLQWGDLDSAALLRDLLRPPDPPALLLIAAFRSEYESASPCLRRLLEPLGDDGAIGRREVRVEPLGHADGRELALGLLGRDDPITAPLAEMIARESGGSPYFVYELVQYLTEGGELTDSLAPAGDVSLDEVLWRRVTRLPDEPRRLIELLAVAGRPVRQASACRAAGLWPQGFDALALLRNQHLIRGTGPGALDDVEAYHDRIRETVVNHLEPSARTAYHRALAGELEDSGGADPETLAVHLEAAGEPEKAGHYYAAAAAGAAEALAFDRAATLYRRVLGLRPARDAEGRRLRARMADALANAGRGSDAARAYQDAADGADRAEALDWQARAGYQYLISGHIDEGLDAFRGVLDRVGLALPGSPRRALLMLLGERLALAVRGLGFRARALDEIAPADLARADIARSASVGISVVDVIQGSYFTTRSLRLALKTGEPFRVALALSWEGVHSACMGRPARRRTARLIGLAREVAERSGHPHAIGMATLSAGAAEYEESRFFAATEPLDRAREILAEQCTGVMWELDTAQIFGLWARMYQGRLAEVSERFHAMYHEAQGRGDRYMESTLGTYPGVFALLAEGNPEGARELADHGIAQWSQHGFHVQHLTHFYGRNYVDLYRGDAESAWRTFVETRPQIEASLLTRIQQVKVDVLQIGARSALAAAARAGEPEPLLRSAERLCAAIERERLEWGEAAARLVRAGVRSVRGDRAGAVAHLEASVRVADAHHIGLFAASARRRLGALLGGDEGHALVAQADAFLVGQGVRNPERMVSCFAPGFDVS